jgi:hypothetical protein
MEVYLQKEKWALQLPSHYEDMTSDDWATIHIDMPARVLTERARTRKRLKGGQNATFVMPNSTHSRT